VFRLIYELARVHTWLLGLDECINMVEEVRAFIRISSPVRESLLCVVGQGVSHAGLFSGALLRFESEAPPV